MAHAQKPDFVFRLNRWVHLNRRGSQFSRLLAAEVCASALVMLDTPPSKVTWEYWLPTPCASFRFTSPPMRHHVPSHSERSIVPLYHPRREFFSVPMRLNLSVETCMICGIFYKLHWKVVFWSLLLCIVSAGLCTIFTSSPGALSPVVMEGRLHYG